MIAALLLTLVPATRWGWIALVAILLALLIVAVVLLKMLRARQLAGAQSAEEGEGNGLDLATYTRGIELRKSFARAVKLLKANTAGRNWRYHIPWFMMVGEASAGKRTVLRNTGLNLPLGKPREEILGLHPGCSWWFFDSGIVLDIFGDYMLRKDGATSDAAGWRTVLRLLRKYRPGRPIDGVVLTIPGSDLTGPHALTPDHRARLGAKADLLRRRLAEAQKTLGMRFPVYVLVTRCNEVAGFESFAREVGARRAEDIFGWSTPYAIENGYATHWVDEAVDTVYQDLHEIELELFASERPVTDGDGLFLFPTEFRAMREPLRIYLDALFKSSVYQESFFFRGVYFCGAAADETAPPTMATVPAQGDDTALAEEIANPPASGDDAESEGRRRVVFVKDFLDRKVFPEYRVARPAPRAFLARTRAMLATQAAVAVMAILGLAGILFGYQHLSEARRTITPLIADTLSDVREARGRMLSGEHTPEAWFAENSVALLKGMSNINVSTTRTLWNPSSYFTTLDRDVQGALTVGYDNIIAKSLSTGLTDRAQRIVARPVTAAPAADVAAPGELAEMTDLRAFVSDLRAYEEHLNAYNGLRLTHDLRALAGLVKYLYSTSLPEDFFQNAGFYQAALKDVQYPEIALPPLTIAASARFRGLVDRLYARVFDSVELKEQLRALSARIDAFDRRSRAGGGSPGLFREVLDTLTRTEGALGRPEVALLAADRFTLGPAWDALLASVEQAKLLGAPARAEAERSGNALLARVRGEFEAQTTAITGPVLERKVGGGGLVLSSGSVALKSALEGVLNLKGAEGAPKSAPRIALAGTERVVWDAKLLGEAVQLYDQYEQFMAAEARKFPDYLEGFVRRGALRNLELNMMDLVSRAADVRPSSRTVSEADVRQEARAFRDATRPAGRLLDIYRQLAFTSSYRDLSTALTAQAHRILRDADHVLLEDGLYAVKEGSIARWDGARRLALVAFEAGDGKDLEQFLELQRERVRLLARDYAEPAVTWIVARGDRRSTEQARLAVKWQRIIGELERYDAKKPGNAVNALERFILVDMEEITRRNYFQKISARDLTEESADFFLQKRNALRRDLYRRAQSIGDSAAATEYAEIEGFFNRRLAGRFPFADPRGIRADAELDLETLRDFYQVFDRYAKPAREILKRSVRFAGGNDAAIDFLDQLDVVRTFVAPLLDKKNPAPGYDVEIDFRVNREREVGGRQIIDWTMQVGEHRVRYRDTKRQARWQVGDPVRIALRWAKDYPYAPTSDGAEGVVIDDRTGTWDYGNAWSMLALMMRQAPPPGDAEAAFDPRPTTLRFTVPMRADRVPGAPAEAGDSQSRVYIRVVLTAGEKKDPLRLPVFPTRAPQLTATARR